jgi:Cu/Ag efflux pump CusA
MKRKHLWWIFGLVTLLGGCAVLAVLVLPTFLESRRQPHAERERAVVVQIVAAYPGASVEEVERQVTIPLEITFAGMPGLEHTYSCSFAGLCGVCVRFADGTAYKGARQEVINRLQFVQNLPAGVAPILSEVHPGGELVRYTLSSPRDAQGKPIYTLRDLRSLQDWDLERDLRRLAGVGEVLGSGGAVKRYEVEPDPDRLKRYGIALQQLVDALVQGNANPGGDLLKQGKVVQVVRGLGLLGAGRDPMEKALACRNAQEAAAWLRAEEGKRLAEIRALVLASVNHIPVKVADIVEGGPVAEARAGDRQGVIVGHQPGQGLVVRSRRGPGDNPEWQEEECVAGIVYLSRQAEGKPSLATVRARLHELSAGPGRLLPGVRLEIYAEPGGDPAGGPLRFVADFPLNASVEDVANTAAKARARLQSFTEVAGIVTEATWPDGSTPFLGFYRARLCVLLRPQVNWPAADGGSPRTRPELVAALEAELNRLPGGLRWRSLAGSQADSLEAFVAGQDEGLLKILVPKNVDPPQPDARAFGPDLDTLDQVARRVAGKLQGLPGIADVRILPWKGPANLNLRIDRAKCARWGVRPAEVADTLAAIGGKVATQMVEGERLFDVVVRWPDSVRNSEAALRKLPVATPAQGGLDIPGAALAIQARVLLEDLLAPAEGKNGPIREAPAVIYREDGQRLLAIRFGAQAGSQVADMARAAREAIQDLLPPGYRAECLP